MFSIYSNDGNISYGIQKFILDTETDLQYLPSAQQKAGSIAFVIETSDTYILNNSKQWKKLDATKAANWEEFLAKE